MRSRTLNVGQRVIIVVGIEISLYLLGQWAIGYWQFGSEGSSGWVAYAPLSAASTPPQVVLHPWVRLVIWLALTLVWVVSSVVLLRRRDSEAAGTTG
jgi:hypothetical protein